jgi:hypothetical protein
MQKSNKFIYWTPRILSILFILFLAMFSLDVITPEASFGDIVLGLLIHNIPVFILIIILIIAWKKEIVGAIAFFIAGMVYTAFTIFNLIKDFHWYYLSWILTIAGPAFLIGILFLISWKRKKKK